MNTMPKYVYPVLLVLLLAVLLPACAAKVPAQTVEEEPKGAPDRLEIVYFHRANPCHCMAVVEDYIRAVLYLDFNRELDNGKLAYKSIVSDDPKNQEIVAKYRAYLFQLFFTEYRGKQERTYPVDGIWALRDDPEKLKAFLREAIRKSLNGEM